MVERFETSLEDNHDLVRIRRLEAENARLRAERAQLSRGINMAMGCLNIFNGGDEALAWYRLSDVAAGKEPRAALGEKS